MRELPQPRDDADRKVLADIASHGWHVIKVQQPDELPGWAFSMGLYHSYGHPEVVLFGLPLERMHTIINVVGELVASGARLHGGAVSDEVLDGYRCAFLDVNGRWYRPFLGYALWLYRGDEFPVTQCFWPDRDDHLPGDPRCSGAISSLQPRLELETEEAAGVADLLRSMERDA